jgi:hypothetical protein
MGDETTYFCPVTFRRLSCFSTFWNTGYAANESLRDSFTLLQGLVLKVVLRLDDIVKPNINLGL